MPIKQAIITYDSDRVAQWNPQAEHGCIFHMFRQALAGNDYPKERGVISIRIVPEDREVILAPSPDEPAVLMVPRMTLGRQTD